MTEIQVTGAAHLSEVGRRLKDAGDGSLRRDLLAGIRSAAKKIIPDVQREARSILPHGGGLGDRVASQKWSVRTSLTSGKVTLTGSGMKELRDIDRGVVRHKIFGRDEWVAQKVVPGFFSKPTDAATPQVRREIDHVLSETAKKIERPL